MAYAPKYWQSRVHVLRFTPILISIAGHRHQSQYRRHRHYGHRNFNAVSEIPVPDWSFLFKFRTGSSAAFFFYSTEQMPGRQHAGNLKIAWKKIVQLGCSVDQRMQRSSVGCSVQHNSVRRSSGGCKVAQWVQCRSIGFSLAQRVQWSSEGFGVAQ